MQRFAQQDRPELGFGTFRWRQKSGGIQQASWTTYERLQLGEQYLSEHKSNYRKVKKQSYGSYTNQITQVENSITNIEQRLENLNDMRSERYTECEQDAFDYA